MSLTLPAAWTQPSGCLASTDVWYWTVVNETFYGDILGAPTATVDCYPPSYTPTIGPAYTAASCPDGFSSAGSANVFSGSWSTVCCPRYVRYLYSYFTLVSHLSPNHDCVVNRAATYTMNPKRRIHHELCVGHLRQHLYGLWV